jgi:hypothetical protein
MVRMEETQEEGEETLEEINELEPEREVWYITSIFMRKDDSRLKDEFEYLWEAHALSSPGEPEEDRWWSPEPPQPSSEEDEEEVQYLTQVLGLEFREDETGQEGNPALVEVVAYPEEGTPMSEASREKKPLRPKDAKRRKPRKKVTRDKDQEWERAKDQEWERARQDAWLREAQEEGDEGQGPGVGAGQAGCLAKGDAY